MRRRSKSSQRQAGFTLIELLITVTIAAILLTVALPSFTDAIERNRIAAETNDLLAAFSLARTEAIRRNATIGMCAANATQTDCAGSWGGTWLIWDDANSDGDVDTGEEVLRVGSIGDKSELSGATTRFSFGPRGLRTFPLASAGASQLTLRPSSCPTGKVNQKRVIAVKISGATSIDPSDRNC